MQISAGLPRGISKSTGSEPALSDIRTPVSTSSASCADERPCMVASPCGRGRGDFRVNVCWETASRSGVPDKLPPRVRARAREERDTRTRARTHTSTARTRARAQASLEPGTLAPIPQRPHSCFRAGLLRSCWALRATRASWARMPGS